MFTPPPSPLPPGPSQKRPCTVPVLGSSSPEDDVFLSATPSGGSSSSWLRSSLSSLSPLPVRETPSPPPAACAQDLHVRSVEAKKRTARRTRWTILLVPAALILIAASTRYLSHPVALDVLVPDYAAEDWQTWAATLTDWRPHKRHPSPQGSGEEPITGPISFPSGISDAGSSLSTGSLSTVLSLDPSATSTTSTPMVSAPSSAAAPTIPQTPPVLPTPFPQALDTTLSQNFSSVGCQNFFVNMTQTGPFLTCRPFSLLLQESSAFINAQTNISLLNTIVWGTCNTDPSEEECVANMEWFATTLQEQCTAELKANYATVTKTLLGLQSYSLLRQAACAADPTLDNNTYCYISATLSSSREDVYFYSLPFGIPLTNGSAPSCSGCTRNLMDLYAVQGTNISGLQKTYDGAAAMTDQTCGGGFARQEVFTSSNDARHESRVRAYAVLAGALAVAGALAFA
ncbi:hypothetical protein OBBRIDRAFT_741478 [Obba rivulosa]|uniref:DUF7729 domain-containing protein n=1 Tax=Obba rivulosa TaxID=1052685 RepID=A0A8E2AHD9_9APHY|nr:hypothetical protein OBBRIDRAFT_741478 [Obba rivulosa]